MISLNTLRVPPPLFGESVLLRFLTNDIHATTTVVSTVAARIPFDLVVVLSPSVDSSTRSQVSCCFQLGSFVTSHTTTSMLARVVAQVPAVEGCRNGLLSSDPRMMKPLSPALRKKIRNLPPWKGPGHQEVARWLAEQPVRQHVQLENPRSRRVRSFFRVHALSTVVCIPFFCCSLQTLWWWTWALLLILLVLNNTLEPNQALSLLEDPWSPTAWLALLLLVLPIVKKLLLFA